MLEASYFDSPHRQGGKINAEMELATVTTLIRAALFSSTRLCLAS